MENKNNADHKDNALDGTAAHFRENPTAPVRILVSTATHLVPGDDFWDRTKFIRNLISQHHWSHDFEMGRDRFESYNAKFGYDNYACYFLIDHGQSPDNNDDAVPILRYRWTGESLVPIHEALPSNIRRRLKKCPFTRPTPAPRTEHPQNSAIERCKDIRAQLHCDSGLYDKDFEFLRENPEHARWLERNIEPRFWLKFKSLEAESLDYQDKLARGIIWRVRKQPKQPKQKREEESMDCTEMWDCECSLCSL